MPSITTKTGEKTENLMLIPIFNSLLQLEESEGEKCKKR